jgi:hypothetical protein
MNKNIIIAALLIILGVVPLSLFTPWWVPPFWVVLIAFVMRLDIKSGLLLGGLSYCLVWIVMAGYLSGLDATELISKTGTLLGGISHQMMFVIILIISLITGALAGWLGSALGKVVN